MLYYHFQQQGRALPRRFCATCSAPSADAVAAVRERGRPPGGAAPRASSTPSPARRSRARTFRRSGCARSPRAAGTSTPPIVAADAPRPRDARRPFSPTGTRAGRVSSRPIRSSRRSASSRRCCSSPRPRPCASASAISCRRPIADAPARRRHRARAAPRRSRRSRAAGAAPVASGSSRRQPVMSTDASLALLAAALVALPPACQRESAPTAPTRERVRRGDRGRASPRRCPAASPQVNAVEGARVAAGAGARDARDDRHRPRARSARRPSARRRDAQLRLLQAGSRPEDIQQAEAQVAAAIADRTAAEAELAAARDRRSALRAAAAQPRRLGEAARRRRRAARAGGGARCSAADDRARGRGRASTRLKAGARPEEIDAARARVAAVDAQIATLEHDRAEADDHRADRPAS